MPTKLGRIYSAGYIEVTSGSGCILCKGLDVFKKELEGDKFRGNAISSPEEIGYHFRF